MTAAEDQHFAPLNGFPDFAGHYQSADLFPFFKNRILAPNRPEWPNYLTWLNLNEKPSSPLTLLERSGGTRATDPFFTFATPSSSLKQPWSLWFFVQSPITPQEPLAGVALQRDNRQLRVHGYNLGDLPHHIFSFVSAAQTPPAIRLVRVNPSPAPRNFRILCQAHFTDSLATLCAASPLLAQLQPVTAAI